MPNPDFPIGPTPRYRGGGGPKNFIFGFLQGQWIVPAPDHIFRTGHQSAGSKSRVRRDGKSGFHWNQLRANPPDPLFRLQSLLLDLQHYNDYDEVTHALQVGAYRVSDKSVTKNRKI